MKFKNFLLVILIIIGIIIIVQNSKRGNEPEKEKTKTEVVKQTDNNEKEDKDRPAERMDKDRSIEREERKKATYLVLGSEDLTFVKIGGNASVNIDTDAENWEVVSTSSWLSLSKSGKSLNVSCPSNNTGKNREQNIVIKADDKTAMIFVSQSATPTHMTLDQTNFTLEISGGSFTVNIDTDVDNWYATCNTGGVSMSKDGNKLHVTVPSLNDISMSWQIVVKGEFNGFTKFIQLINVRQKGYCSACRGQGKQICSMCHGSGQQANYTLEQIFYEPCHWCKGARSFICGACNGTGLSK